MEQLPARLVDERFLDPVDLLAEPLQDQEIVVDNRVDEGVGQVIGAELADTALSGPDALADGTEVVAGGLLERDGVSSGRRPG